MDKKPLAGWHQTSFDVRSLILLKAPLDAKSISHIYASRLIEVGEVASSFKSRNV